MPVKNTIDEFKSVVKSRELSAPDDAFKSCLQRKSGISLPYVVYRWSQFMLHFMIALASFLDYNRTWSPNYEAPKALKKHGVQFYAKWLLYFTHWGCCMNMVQSLIGATVLTKAYFHRGSPRRGSTVYGVSRQLANAYCNMFRLALVCSVYITAGFWVLIWNPDIFAVDLVLSGEHGVGMVLMLLDLIVIQFPYTMITGVYALGISSIYFTVTVIHYLAGALDRYQNKTFIYELQDWDKPWATAFSDLGAIFSLGTIHFAMWGLDQAKRRLLLANRLRPQ